MSEFSDLLSLFIKNRNINVSALTGYCDLDRSTMYKLISGKRSPASRELVQNLASFMNLNPVELQELMEAYQLTKVGWDTYYRRKNVLEFILGFTGMAAEAFPSSTPTPDFSDLRLFSQKIDADSIPLTGQLQLSSTIHHVLQEAASHPSGNISLFAQPEHLEALSVAASLPPCKSEVKIQHILCINNSKSYIKSQQNYNIQCLKKLIPFYGIPYEYQPYYYYDNVNSHFNNLNFMPCMFLTDKAGILCSGDLKEGVLLKEESVIRLFQKRFQEILKKTNPLTLSFSSNLTLHLKNFASVYADTSCIYSLSADPCLLPTLTPDLIDKYVRKDMPGHEALVEDFKIYLKALSSTHSHLYFTKNGVMNFLTTGRLHEIPNDMYHPIAFPDRIRMLRRFCDFVNSTRDIRLLKGTLEKFPLNLNLCTASNYGYLMFSTFGGKLSYLLLQEQNLLTSFFDFAYSLEESDMLETKEETLQFLNSVIEQNYAGQAVD